MMNENICLHCGKAFKIDESGYADLLKQVRDHEFEKQLNQSLELAERDKDAAVELAKTQVASAMQMAASEKEAEILELQAKLKASDTEQQLAIAEASKSLEKERDDLINRLQQSEQDRQTSLELTEARFTQQLQETVATKDAEIQR
tara:strand:- start:21464 stop:21901 length:438 start_codon:yes stop_codon:yes gene_type:complete